MRFSNDNLTWSSWEAYATSKTWTLTPGDGTKTVYVKFADAAGIISPGYSDTILLYDPYFVGSFEDDFSGFDTGVWETWHRNGGGSAIVSGNIRLGAPPIGAPGLLNFSRGGIHSKKKIEGGKDFQVALDWSSVSIPATADAVPSRLILYQDDQNYIFIDRYRSASGADKLRAGMLTNGSLIWKETPNTALSGSFRIRRLGALVTVDYNVGSGWVTLAWRNPGPAGDMNIYLGTYNWSLDSEAQGDLNTITLVSGPIWPYTLTDDFNTLESSRWSAWHRNGGSNQIVSGALHLTAPLITTPGLTNFSRGGVQSIQKLNGGSDFQLTLKWKNATFPPPSGDVVPSRLILYKDDQNYVFIDRYRSPGQSNQLRAGMLTGGSVTWKTVASNASFAGFRVSRLGTLVTVEYNTGAGWVTLASRNPGPSGDIYVYLGTYNWSLNAPATCDFDTLSIGSDSPVFAAP
jgi:hypothetical protein